MFCALDVVLSASNGIWKLCVSNSCTLCTPDYTRSPAPPMGPAGIVAAGLLYQPRSLHTLGSIYKNDHWHVVFNSRYLPAGQKAISFGQKRPQQTIWFKQLTV